jgi:propanol-preferring alcohol dehydrogenase
MKAMVLRHPHEPLLLEDVPLPALERGQLLIEILACAVCRTDLHVVDDELPKPKLPLIPGHEIIGRVSQLGPECTRFSRGDRVGVPWLGWTCGACRYCLSGKENLCGQALFTGYTLDGGYAEFTAADERFCYAIPDKFEDANAAPLLCAGLIGYRSLRKCGDASAIGIYGFGAAAHILIQVARQEGREVFAFTRPGDIIAQEFARSLGAAWAGDSSQRPPAELDAAIIFAPAGSLVPKALQATRRGGVVVCGGIHMSDIPSFPYEWLWGERQIVSVANLTRQDAEEFMNLAAHLNIETQVQSFPLLQANEALDALRGGRLKGAAVLAP